MKIEPQLFHAAAEGVDAGLYCFCCNTIDFEAFRHNTGPKEHFSLFTEYFKPENIVDTSPWWPYSLYNLLSDQEERNKNYRVIALLFMEQIAIDLNIKTR